MPCLMHPKFHQFSRMLAMFVELESMLLYVVFRMIPSISGLFLILEFSPGHSGGFDDCFWDFKHAYLSAYIHGADETSEF